ncbi:LCP family protein [Lactococcus nasutitermitis]|uniref:LCP family protein n=1 Tax=Lactococcus nasutitermitis TaxID=1652957 RepID=A0ABV9JCJ9_9LACT|nr:LCP family protein [Lactococcus nasutitermitis]
MERQTSKRKRHHHRKHRYLGLKIFLGILAVLIIVGAGVAFGLYKSVENSFNSAYFKGPKTAAVNFKKSEPFSTLLLETGKVEGKENCVAAVVSSTNMKTRQTTFVNFPVTAELPNASVISNVYQTNGLNGVLKNVQELLGIKVNKIVQININKLGELVEATGGITIQNDETFVSSGYQFNQGTIKLSTANQVEAYLSRVNSNDEAASITRVQDVSMATYANFKQIADKHSLSSINYYRNLLDAFGDSVKTDINFNEFKEIAVNYNKALFNTNKLNLHDSKDASGKLVVSDDDLNQMKALFIKSFK